MLSGHENFVGEREKFIFNAFVDLKPMERLRMGVIHTHTHACVCVWILKPMERLENGNDMCGFMSPNNSTSKSFESVGAG